MVRFFGVKLYLDNLLMFSAGSFNKLTSKRVHIAFPASARSPGEVRITLATNGFAGSEATVSATLNAASNKNPPSSIIAPVYLNLSLGIKYTETIKLS